MSTDKRVSDFSFSVKFMKTKENVKTIYPPLKIHGANS